MRKTALILGALYLVSLLMTASAQSTSRPRLPAFGRQNPWNRYQSKLTLIYSTGFETAREDLVQTAPAVAITANRSEVIDGSFSLKMAGPQAGIMIRADSLQLEPAKIYTVEYQYRILRRATQSDSLRVKFISTRGPVAGQAVVDLGGPGLGAPDAGADSRGMRVANIDGITVGFQAVNAEVVIDNLRIYRHDAEVHWGRVRLMDVGFPRLASYSRTTPAAVSARSGVALAQVEANLARADLLLGADLDHTFGAAAWVSRLRQINPKLRVVPYQRTFMTQNLDRSPVWETSGLLALFNRSLYPEFFMVDVRGNRLVEPQSPQNVQMDHTPLALAVRNTDGPL
ncbi:MAG: hypothetical protein ACREUU_20735, partial [Gammaproteobacteria bacterium]